MELSEIQVKYVPPLKANRTKVTCSADAYQYLSKAWSELIDFQEEFYILILNRANEVLGYRKVGEGGISGVVADSKVIFGIALKCAASSIILAHNHPSGNLRPSEADLKVTSNFVSIGKILELPVLDHIIVSSEGYYSFKDEGQLF